MSSERIKQEYPLHWFVWHNDPSELQKAIELNTVSSVMHLLTHI